MLAALERRQPGAIPPIAGQQFFLGWRRLLDEPLHQHSCIRPSGESGCLQNRTGYAHVLGEQPFVEIIPLFGGKVVVCPLSLMLSA